MGSFGCSARRPSSSLMRVAGLYYTTNGLGGVRPLWCLVYPLGDAPIEYHLRDQSCHHCCGLAGTMWSYAAPNFTLRAALIAGIAALCESTWRSCAGKLHLQTGMAYSCLRIWTPTHSSPARCKPHCTPRALTPTLRSLRFHTFRSQRVCFECVEISPHPPIGCNIPGWTAFILEGPIQRTQACPFARGQRSG